MTSELVSIITPSYNSAQFVGQMIESVQAQTYTNWELLITDDCSTDNSYAIIRRYARNDNRIKPFRLLQNSGAGVARNESIKRARGRYIAFCDSDDMWKPNKLERQIEFMRDNEYPFCYSSYDVVSETGEQTGYIKCRGTLSYASLIRSNEIGCLTSIYDAEKLGKMYMPTIRKRQDWGLWLSIIKRCKTAHGVAESLAIYRNRQGSISSNKMEMLKYNYKLYNEVEGFSKFSSAALLLLYFMPYHCYKKLKQKISYNWQS